jgi:hypothetical protein
LLGGIRSEDVIKPSAYQVAALASWAKGFESGLFHGFDLQMGGCGSITSTNCAMQFATIPMAVKQMS